MDENNTEPVTKGDIINHLIRQFGFSTYLEYNKFDGATYFEDIVCPHKEIAYLPETSYLDGRNIKRLLGIAEQVRFDLIMGLEQLQLHCQGRKFDIIFFDPVHVRPDVDLALQTLPRLLNPGGMLVVHDCNPEDVALTTLKRRVGSWVGETFKAFALFRHFNRAQSITINEDFGVGLVWNKSLNLDYPITLDIDYFDFAQDRQEYLGLINYPHFIQLSASGHATDLFAQPPKRHSIKLKPTTFANTGPAATPGHPRVPRAWVEAQIYWKTAVADYTAKNALNYRYELDAQVANLKFTLPKNASEIQELRLDFADMPISCRLQSIQIRDPQQALVWEWQMELSIFLRPRQLQLFQTIHQQLYMQAGGDDPRIYLSLPGNIMQQLTPGFSLHIALIPYQACVHDLLSELHTAHSSVANDQVVLLNVKQSQLLDASAELQQRCAYLERQMQQLDHMLLQWRTQTLPTSAPNLLF